MAPTRTTADTASAPSNRKVMLELRDVVKCYGDVSAVAGVSFSVHVGEVFTLLGPSGCGKSTTLRLVAGLEDPDDGEIALDGRAIASPRQGIFVPPERRNMGMVFQSYAIWPHFTVFENVAFPLRVRRWPRQRIRERVHETLEVVGLSGLEDRPSTMLSGGQQQRVALARALAYNPELLLLDEPLSNLDAKLREQMRLELKRIQRQLGIAMLFVTHDQAEAMTLSDRVAVMDRGRIEQIGAPSEVYERPASPFVRDFLGRAVVLRGTVRRTLDGSFVTLDEESDRVLWLAEQALDGLADGTPVLVSCRPEDAWLEGAQADDSRSLTPNRVPVRVEEVSYLGERVEYAVSAPGGQSFLVYGGRRGQHQIGAELDLVLDPASATVWPA